MIHTEPNYPSGIPKLSGTDQGKRPTKEAYHGEIVFSRQIHIRVIPPTDLPGNRKNRVIRVFVTPKHWDY